MAPRKGHIFKPLIERFLDKVEITHGCWLWTGAQDGRGYGQINVAGKPAKAHRVSWELFVGAIPRGLTIDHLCRVTLCVNPDHLEPVTLAENTRRELVAIGSHNAEKTSCPNGHPYDKANTRYASRGYGRVCRECRKESSRRYRKSERVA